MYALLHTGLTQGIAAGASRYLSGALAAALLLIAGPALAGPPQGMSAAEQAGLAKVYASQFPESSDMARRMVGWIMLTRDNRGLPFVIVDKADAKVFVFDKNGQALGAAKALLGMAQGDDSVEGIGTMPLAQITPDMRTTPSGRFVASMGRDLGTDVLWVDYKNAISLHRVINTNPKERRLQRIVSASAADHRISYGCINVPVKFFDGVVLPAFSGTNGIVYVLPEVKSLKAVFPTYFDLEAEPAQQAQAGNSAPVAYRETPDLVDNHDLPGIVH